MTFGEPFDTLRVNYLNSHAKAADPIDYVRALGVERLIEIMKEANGRKIVFREQENLEGADDAPVIVRYGEQD